MKYSIYGYLALLIIALAACTKQDWTDTSLAASAANPGKIMAQYSITQDNTGLVTIVPNGEGAVKYDVYFADGTSTPTSLMAGDKVQHIFKEGVYQVKIVAYGLNGSITETIQPLTVSFRKPENFEATVGVDGSNNFKVNVSAKAIYETNFAVYFGDVDNEIPQSFMEGETISHVYSKTGDFTVRVVALSGGAAKAEIIKTITILDPLLLPVTFESPTINYGFINFGGGDASVATNPSKSGINTSNKVGKMIKQPGEVWGGTVFSLSEAINFSAGKIFRVKVFSPRVGAKLLFKIENQTDGGIFYEKEVATKTANAWEELGFDFSGINTANSYQKIVLIFDLGTAGDGTENFTYYFDDITLSNQLPASVKLPLDFQMAPAAYAFINFDGGQASVVSNPHPNGINTSTQTGKMVKGSGQPWGGALLSLEQPINFADGKYFRMKVYSPRVGAKVLLKFENKNNPGINYEQQVATTVANSWEDLLFDFNGINAAEQYHNLVIIFELGTVGDGTDNFTFYFDDIRQQVSYTPTLSLPLTFESPGLNYSFLNFDGGNATITANPHITSANNSATVGKMIKGAGQPWGGSFITLDQPIDFAAGKTMSVKVFSPRAGAKLLLKVENKDNGALSYEKELTINSANQWETLHFDYSGINMANEYHKVVLIFDLGTVGDGSENFTFYFDDIHNH